MGGPYLGVAKNPICGKICEPTSNQSWSHIVNALRVLDWGPRGIITPPKSHVFIKTLHTKLSEYVIAGLSLSLFRIKWSSDPWRFTFLSHTVMTMENQNYEKPWGFAEPFRPRLSNQMYLIGCPESLTGETIDEFNFILLHHQASLRTKGFVIFNLETFRQTWVFVVASFWKYFIKKDTIFFCSKDRYIFIISLSIEINILKGRCQLQMSNLRILLSNFRGGFCVSTPLASLTYYYTEPFTSS